MSGHKYAWLSLVIFLAGFTAPFVYANDDNYFEYASLRLGEYDNSMKYWVATAYIERTERDKYPSQPAKVCFHNVVSNQTQCEFPESSKHAGENFDLLDVIWLHGDIEPRLGVLFFAFTRVGDSSFSYMTLWTYDKNRHRFKNELPDGISITSLDEYAFFPFLGKRQARIFVATKCIWDAEPGKGIWDDHKYLVRIFEYKHGKGYRLKGNFETKRKYLRVDSKVITSEMANILKIVDE